MLTKRATTAIYAAACASYLVFSFLTFPVFDVPVFGFTVPLAMLGGWFYRYRGAFLTTFLVIPYNFSVLYFYVDEPELIGAMAVGAITFTLLFSVGTAYLRLNQQRVLKLNASLEKIVEERTADLRNLAEHLIEEEDAENKKKTSSLLQEPLKGLTDMQRSSERLVHNYEAMKHADLQQAKTVDRLIREAISHLENLDSTRSPSSPDIGKAIHALVSRFSRMSKARIEMTSNDLWGQLDAEITNHLYHILHEALTNAVRHSNASRIYIGIEEEAGTYTVFVQNDGDSMPDEVNEGMGFSLMRYHASKMGASLEIDRIPGQGTTISCRIQNSQSFIR